MLGWLMKQHQVRMAGVSSWDRRIMGHALVLTTAPATAYALMVEHELSA